MLSSSRSPDGRTKPFRIVPGGPRWYFTAMPQPRSVRRDEGAALSCCSERTKWPRLSINAPRQCAPRAPYQRFSACAGLPSTAELLPPPLLLHSHPSLDPPISLQPEQRQIVTNVCSNAKTRRCKLIYCIILPKNREAFAPDPLKVAAII